MENNSQFLSQSDSNIFLPPLNIIINNFRLSLKDKREIRNGFFSYRCKKRNICNGLFHFKTEDLKSFVQSELFNLCIYKSINNHTEKCLNIKENLVNKEEIKKILNIIYSSLYLFM